MDSIKLTAEHKATLLKMAVRLFPELNFYTGINDAGMIHWFPRKGGAIQSMHWFEFIMCHLIDGLQNVLSKELGDDVVWEEQSKWTLYTKFHFAYPKAMNGGSVFRLNPIDFLFEYFKLLKL